MSSRLEMTSSERRRYVHWWIHSSGLTKEEVRRIATAVWWFDSLVDDAVRKSFRAV